jgi:TP53 regulating kinase-like protein
MQLIAQGAEARVYRAENGDLCKERFKKRYRHPTLDAKLSKTRHNKEVKCMAKALEAGVPVPKVLRADKDALTIHMEFIPGDMIKAVFARPTTTDEEKCAIGATFGAAIAKLHSAGMVHGDLTTSNAIMRARDNVLVLIDFGLAGSTKSVEDFAVDLYVLQRALLSAHPNSEFVFGAIMQGYASVNEELHQKVANQLAAVASRGRKKLAFG